MKINARITILATYNDLITITIGDKDAGITFLDLELTREQFINATMNRLGCTEVKNAEVRGLEHVGKIQEFKEFSFVIPNHGSRSDNEQNARRMVIKLCPIGWTPDLEFSSSDSFYEKDGKEYARTLIRRWVDKS